MAQLAPLKNLGGKVFDRVEANLGGNIILFVASDQNVRASAPAPWPRGLKRCNLDRLKRLISRCDGGEGGGCGG